MKTSLQLFVALFLLTLVGMNAQAREINVVTISNEETKFQYNLILETNDRTGDIVRFHKDKIDPARKATRLARETFVVNKIDDNGIVLDRSGKYDVLKLKSENFAAHNGGDLVMDTLHNGINGERKEFEFELAREGDQWVLLRNGKVTQHIHFVSKKVMLVGTVGVKDIVVK